MTAKLKYICCSVIRTNLHMHTTLIHLCIQCEVSMTNGLAAVDINKKVPTPHLNKITLLS